jgi:ABC-type sugar transport system permease subunit
MKVVVGGMPSWQATTPTATIDPEFLPAVRHNMIWLAVFMLIATPLGMLFTVVIDRGIKGSRMYWRILMLALDVGQKCDGHRAVRGP